MLRAAILRASGRASGSASSIASGSASGIASGIASGSTSGTASGSASDTASGSASDTASDTANDTATGIASGSASDTASDTASGSASDTASDSVYGFRCLKRRLPEHPPGGLAVSHDTRHELRCDAVMRQKLAWDTCVHGTTSVARLAWSLKDIFVGSRQCVPVMWLNRNVHKQLRLSTISICEQIFLLNGII